MVRTMESQTTPVAVRERPRPGSTVGIISHGQDILIEQRNQLLRMGRRADTIVVQADGVCHVRLVVRAVEVDAVPARREVHLCAHPARALVLEEVGTLVPGRIVAVIVVIVYTCNVSTFRSASSNSNKATDRGRRN